MISNSKDCNKIISISLPNFKLRSSFLQFATESKYLGHMNADDSSDDVDIQHEFRNMFARANMFARRFLKYSTSDKVLIYGIVCLVS
jgi:hypothetical protein